MSSTGRSRNNVKVGQNINVIIKIDNMLRTAIYLSHTKLLCYHKYTRLHLPRHESSKVLYMYPAIQTHIEDPIVFTQYSKGGLQSLSPLTHSSTSENIKIIILIHVEIGNL